MQSFYLNLRTEIYFGRNSEARTAEAVRKHGGGRILLVYGSGSVVRSGLLDRLTRQLADAGLFVETLGGVKPNPLLSLAREGVRKALDMGADFILGVGGGSVIDTAKGIALGAANPDVDIWRFWKNECKPQQGLPVGAILTLAAAGSETSDSAVLTNDETMEKRGLSCELNRPRFAIMNPELTFTLPRYQVTCGIVDIMMHTLDRYFTPTGGNETTDELSEAVLRTTIRNGTRAYSNSTEYEPMSELMWCGSLSHNSLTGLGAVADFATHQLGHELSARFDAAHGASLSAVWGSWARAVYQAKPSRFARYARTVWGIVESDDLAAAQLGIESTLSYWRSIDMPANFGELGIGVQPERIIYELAHRCSFLGTRTIGSFKVLDEAAIEGIYRDANR